MRRTGETARVKGASRLLGVAVAALTLCGGAVAHAAPTPAGTQIRNIASARFEVDGAPASIPSNLVITLVDELLDVQLRPKTNDPVKVPDRTAPDFGVPFILTNSGNGTEAFILSVTVPGEAVSPSVAIDVDGNGVYDPAVDIDLSATGQTPPLAPGASLDLLVRFGTAPTKTGVIDLSARAATGNGTPGTRFNGAGDSGTMAIVGQTDALASVQTPFSLQSITPRDSDLATLVKSQTVRAPDGTDSAISGATITYRLELATTGLEALEDAEIVDPIPAGTRYVPGSLHLNGAARSDAADSDAAQFDGAQIRVALGDLSQPTTQVVTFQVIIQ